MSTRTTSALRAGLEAARSDARTAALGSDHGTHIRDYHRGQEHGLKLALLLLSAHEADEAHAQPASPGSLPVLPVLGAVGAAPSARSELLPRRGKGWHRAAAKYYRTHKRANGAPVSFRDVARAFGRNVKTVIMAVRGQGVAPNYAPRGRAVPAAPAAVAS